MKQQNYNTDSAIHLHALSLSATRHRHTSSNIVKTATKTRAAEDFRVPRYLLVTASLAKFKKDNHTTGVMRNHYLTRVRYAKVSKVGAINHFTVTVKLVQQQFYMTRRIVCSSCISFLQVFSTSTTNGARGCHASLLF